MGCGSSTFRPPKEMTNAEKSMKAAILIQTWYRRYLARLETRRRYTWSIFQSLEYEGEQDQLRLYNFFNEMMSRLQLSYAKSETQPNSLLSILSAQTRPGSADPDQRDDLFKVTNPDSVTVPEDYSGPRLSIPITSNQVECLVRAFKRKKVLHAHYLLTLLHEMRRALKRLPTVTHASTKLTQQITVCGDLHGKLDDLLIIFYKSGLPEFNNPYIFNGDFVDRGPHSVEVAVLLFSCFLANPNSVFINRGNHEDHVMNLRYGFVKEIMSKYRGQASKLLRLFEDVFSWLPLATIIDDKILVCHGGVSERTNIGYLSKIDRHRYLSALRPPVNVNNSQDSISAFDNDDDIDIEEWKQVLDVLWSDPKPSPGCHPNTFRGGGSYFGPDVTERFLKKNNLDLLIRSHECKPEGYEFTHNDKVLTIFSASNYYEMGSNKGAYIKLGPDLKPRIIRFMATRHTRQRSTIKQSVGYVENSALRALQGKIYSSRTVLLEAFRKYDITGKGLIMVNEWCDAMQAFINLDLPWRSIRPKLVRTNQQGLVMYNSTFEDIKLETKLKDDSSSVTEALYRNKSSLETIFRAIDKDNSGYISMDEFEEACDILSEHSSITIPKEHVLNMAHNMDMNKDGLIDFNEFLEAFRIVDQFGKDLNRRLSQESTSSLVEGSPSVSTNAVMWSPTHT